MPVSAELVEFADMLLAYNARWKYQDVPLGNEPFERMNLSSIVYLSTGIGDYSHLGAVLLQSEKESFLRQVYVPDIYDSTLDNPASKFSLVENLGDDGDRTLARLRKLGFFEMPSEVGWPGTAACIHMFAADRIENRMVNIYVRTSPRTARRFIRLAHWWLFAPHSWLRWESRIHRFWFSRK